MKYHKSFDYIFCVSAGLLIGYVIGDDSAGISDLEEQLSALESRSAPEGPSSSGRAFAEEAHQVPQSREGGAPSEQPTEESEAEREARRIAGLIDDFVHREGMRREAVYGPLFADLGIDFETSTELFDQMETIARSSVVTEQAMKEVIRARQGYRQALQEAMSEEAYEKYQDFETSRPALSEFDKFEAHLAAREGLDIGPSEKEAIVELMKDGEVYTERRWHGPFDPMPQPLIGEDMIADEFERRVPGMVARAETLLAGAEERGLSEDILNGLQDYYQGELDKKIRTIERFRQPIEVLMQERLETANALLRR